DLHGADRLQQHRLALRHALAHGDAGRRLERHVRAVDGVILAVIERDRYVDDREPERTAIEKLARPLLPRRYVLPRYRAADDMVDDLEAGAARQRLDLDMDVPELAVAAALLLVAPMLLDAAADGLLVVDGRTMRLDREAVFELQAIDRHLEM